MQITATGAQIDPRMPDLPRNVVIIQTSRGRFQIDVSEDGIRVVCLDIDGEIAVLPRTSNIVDIRMCNGG